MGVVTSVLFAGRNGYKCVNQHEGTRGAVALCQSVSSLDGISSSTSSLFSGLTKSTGNVLKGADEAVENLFKNIGGEAGEKTLEKITTSTGASTKIGALAQKAVNPLLCVAAGVRVLNDDDQYAALIEETSAMATMFGAESVMKYARSALTNSSQATTGLAGKTANLLSSSSSIKGLAEKASKWYKNLGTSTNGSAKQMIVRIGLDALFVGGSILAYNVGKKIGEFFSHRGDEENNKA